MEHKMASHGSLPCSSRCHEHISSSQAEWSQITKKTWMLSTYLFFLQAIHHPPYRKKRDQSLVTKFPQLAPLRPNLLQKAIFHFPPPMVPTLPTLQCANPVFFHQLGSLRAPLWPSGSDQKLPDPYLPAKPQKGPTQPGGPRRGRW